MNIRKFAVMTVVCISPFAAMAQSTDGGSAGDGNKPTTYTRADFGSADKNHDGILDKKELLAAKLDSALIKKMDTNGDGTVSQAEFDAYQSMTEGNKVPKK